MRLSVIIPARNEEDYIIPTLISLSYQTLNPESKEIILGEILNLCKIFVIGFRKASVARVRNFLIPFINL